MASEPEIYAGNWGHTHTITVLDQDGAVVDLSTTTAKVIVFQDPDGNQVEKTAAFVTDGTDGKVQYQVEAAADVDDEAGSWKRWARVTWANQMLTSSAEEYPVFAAGGGN